MKLKLEPYKEVHICLRVSEEPKQKGRGGDVQERKRKSYKGRRKRERDLSYIISNAHMIEKDCSSKAPFS